MSKPKLQTLTQKELKELLDYDEVTGKFTWKVQSGRQKAGDVAGSFSKKIGYFLIGVKGVRHYAHRLAWLYMTGEWPEHVVDHKDTNGANNSFKNLQAVTQRKNINKAERSGGVYGVPGVIAYPPSVRKNMKNHFHAKIVVDGINIGLGSFYDVKSAYEAYAEAKEKHHGVKLKAFKEYGVSNVRSPISA